MSYTIWMHRLNEGQVESKIFDIGSLSEKDAWLLDNPEWCDAIGKVYGKKEPENGPSTIREKEKEAAIDSVDLTREQLENVVLLLRGQQVGGRTGLSLTSFANLHGASFSERANQKKLKPKYEALLAKLGGEIELTQKKWFYKSIKKR